MAEQPAQHATCIETTTVRDLPHRKYVCGPECPRPAGPDPERDRRVDAYRDRERRRAARALDRYIEVVFTATDPQGAPTNQSAALTLMTASERFVEQVGDYVLARLGERAAAGGDVPADADGKLHSPGCRGAFGVPCAEWCDVLNTERE